MIHYQLIQRAHLSTVLSLCQSEGYSSYTHDPEITWEALTAPGVCTVVAVDGDEVLGFAQMQSDGQIQAHLSLVLVAAPHRRKGIGRRLVAEAFVRCGGKRVDLVTDGADDFYRSFKHKKFSGYRLYWEE